MVDTGVFIQIERRRSDRDLRDFLSQSSLAISVVTVSELLVGVHRSDTEARRSRRNDVLQSIIASLPVHAFTLGAAHLHARLYECLQSRGQIIGAHDLIIAATALEHGHAVLTTNRREFDRVVGLTVIEFPSAS